MAKTLLQHMQCLRAEKSMLKPIREGGGGGNVAKEHGPDFAKHILIELSAFWGGDHASMKI